jgi:hypothetical protein
LCYIAAVGSVGSRGIDSNTASGSNGGAAVPARAAQLALRKALRGKVGRNVVGMLKRLAIDEASLLAW